MFLAEQLQQQTTRCFECKDCSVNGGSLGLTVTASNQENGRAGGAIGYGTGGEVRKTSVTNLNSVTAGKCAGGFAGYFGSGTLLMLVVLNFLDYRF